MHTDLLGEKKQALVCLSALTDPIVPIFQGSGGGRLQEEGLCGLIAVKMEMFVSCELVQNGTYQHCTCTNKGSTVSARLGLVLMASLCLFAVLVFVERGLKG